VLPDSPASSDRLAVLLGPEGGWTDEERRLSLDAAWLAVSLGPQILRAETAAAAALAILTSRWLTAYNRT